VRRFVGNRILDITDGTSLTLMLAEKRINLRYLGEWQDDDNEGYTAGWNDDTLRRTTRVPAQDHTLAFGNGFHQFGSSHPGRMNAVFADGSIHTITYSIGRAEFEALGDKSDGKVLHHSDF